jgi:hypothetical protein
MRETGALIAEVLGNIANEDALADVRQKVGALTARFPLYDWKRRASLNNPSTSKPSPV